MVVGITGSSGSGKSEISKIFEKEGFLVIDCDAVVKKLQKKGADCYKEIVEHFGAYILKGCGALNRKRLADIVFSDPQKLSKLNEITHKYVLSYIEEKIAKTKKDVLIDAPVLFEAGADKLCDKTVAVVSDAHVQIKRICARDGIDEESAQKRLANQHSNDFYTSKCDFTILNNGNLKETEESVLDLIKKIKEI